MKKLGLLIMPFISIFFLFSCNTYLPQPEPVADVTHKFAFIGENCTINGKNKYIHDIYEKDENVEYTIVPDLGFSLPESVNGSVDYDKQTGVITIKKIVTDLKVTATARRIPQPTTYTVKFLDGDNKTLLTIENVVSGTTVKYEGDVPTKTSTDPSLKYKFKGWDRDIEEKITSYTEFKACFDEVKLFKVTFYNDNRTALKGGDDSPYYVEKGENPIPPASEPTKDPTEGVQYKFKDWEPKLAPISGDTNYVATYNEIKDTFKVTFSLPSDAILYESNYQNVSYYDCAEKPKINPYRPGYSFKGWYQDGDYKTKFDFATTHIRGNTVIYSGWEEDPKFAVPLCFKSNVDNNILLECEKFYYKINLTDDWTYGDNKTTIKLNTGDQVYIGSDNGYDFTAPELSFPTNSFTVSGNIMSLINHADFQFLSEVGESNFYNLFANFPDRPVHLTDASGLLLPATKLAASCYYNMFYNLPIIATPKLPAIVLADSCYKSMFEKCASLLAAPELLAETLINSCYYNMFRNCSSLEYVKVGFSRFIPAEYINTYYWLEGTSQTGTFVWQGSTDFADRKASTIPQSWTIENY